MVSAQALAAMTGKDSQRQAWRLSNGLKGILLLLCLVILTGCSGSGVFAPVTNLSDRGVDGTYRVQPGDTLSSISRETGVSVDRLIALNNISNPSLIRVGQQLRLNDGARVTQTASAPAPEMGSMARARGEVETAPVASAAPAPARVTPAPDASRLGLVWPAQGEIIERFSSTNNGIDIGGKVGEPVIASADGKVVFAGDAVRGFGNLVIVDHGSGFITAYAHNEKLMVAKGDTVKRSQQIATLGQSATTSPRLHFEVRHNGKPVDPLRYLPPR